MTVALLEDTEVQTIRIRVLGIERIGDDVVGSGSPVRGEKWSSLHPSRLPICWFTLDPSSLQELALRLLTEDLMLDVEPERIVRVSRPAV